MTLKRLELSLTLLCGLGAVGWPARGAAQGASSLDDIRYWVGEGANRAAVAIDWDGAGDEDHALVWGYRWEGQANGEAMLRAVVAADPRLFLRLGDAAQFPFGVAVFGVGYDADGDGQFGVAGGDVEFDAEGFAVTTPPIPPFGPSDADDFYREGWTAQRAWTYGRSVGNPWTDGQWQWSGGGATSRTLADGDWDSWAFSLTATTAPDVFAANPIAAVPASTADFNGDGAVDGADLLRWQQGLGIALAALPSDGDATGDGAVDGADLSAWSNQFGVGAEVVAHVGSISPTLFTPAQRLAEPAAAPQGGIALLSLFSRRSRQLSTRSRS